MAATVPWLFRFALRRFLCNDPPPPAGTPQTAQSSKPRANSCIRSVRDVIRATWRPSTATASSCTAPSSDVRKSSSATAMAPIGLRRSCSSCLACAASRAWRTWRASCAAASSLASRAERARCRDASPIPTPTPTSAAQAPASTARRAGNPPVPDDGFFMTRSLRQGTAPVCPRSSRKICRNAFNAPRAGPCRSQTFTVFPGSLDTEKALARPLRSNASPATTRHRGEP